MKIKLFLSVFTILVFSLVSAQKTKESSIAALDSKSEKYSAIAQEIWNYAEMGYQETKSSALLQKTLQDEGFNIKTGVANIPTAFTAEYGSGYPVIAILGEFDALPGLSQKAIPEKESAGKIAGHACGHHLFGTASSAAAIAVKDWMKANKQSGTIRFYGCPAEEGGGAKVYMLYIGTQVRKMLLVLLPH